ncbi:MAG: DUF1847 domain-containing protein [Clostridium sp.]
MPEKLFCASCGIKNCARILGKEGEYPKNCPSARAEIPEFLKEYQEPETLLLARASAVSSMDYTESRVQQTVRFARNCGYQKIGIAFCVTLAESAKILAAYLKKENFEVESIICKVGRHDRECIGIFDPRKKPMCNPIAQAEYLNQAGTELNLIVGLCVGHDSLFIKYSKAPVVCLVAKDHAFHNAPEEFLKAIEARGEGE